MAKNKLKSPKKRKGLNKKRSSKPPRDIVINYSSGNIFSLFFFTIIGIIPGFFFVWDAFQGVYVDVGMLSLSLICFAAPIAFFYFKSKKQTYTFSQERLEIIEQKGKKITIYPFDNVIGYYDYEFNYGSSEGERLLLKTETELLSFSSNDYYSYPSLKHFAKANFDKLNPNVYRKYYWKRRLPFLILIVVIIMTGIPYGEKNAIKIRSTPITFLEKPILHRNTGKSGNSGNYYTWEFKVKEYPEFIFKLPKKKTNVDLKRFSKNSKIGILVEENILEMKLLKTKEPTFRLKHFSWENVFVKGLKLVE